MKQTGLNKPNVRQYPYTFRQYILFRLYMVHSTAYHILYTTLETQETLGTFCTSSCFERTCVLNAKLHHKQP